MIIVLPASVSKKNRLNPVLIDKLSMDLSQG